MASMVTCGIYKNDRLTLSLIVIIIALGIFSFQSKVANAAPYDCSADANCVAQYNFESGALTTDSEGTNTLTSNGSPDEDALNYRQGSGSVDLSRTPGDWYSVSDASLDADFPGKVVSSMSSCFWVRPEEASPDGNRYIMSKFAATPSPFIVQYTTARKIKVFIGASTSTLEHATALTVNQWYHVCFSYDNADDSGRIHIYDDTGAATLGSDATGTFSSSMTTDATDNFVIGSNSAGAVNNRFEGNIDEMLIFKDVLSTGEMDTIRAGATPNPDVVIVSTPVQYKTFQRTTDTTGPIAITGQYAGSPTAIECSFDSGAYATVDATPSSGSWSGTLTGSVGDGSLQCRFTNDTDVNVTISDVRMGDVYMVIGQSNAHGRGDNDQSYTGSNHGASQFDTSDNWEALGDSNDFLSALYGSVWPLLGTLLNDNDNIPVAFIGYASGGTGFTGNDWNQGDSAYNAAVNQFNDSGVNDIKAFLWYQGENDASLGMSASAYETALSAMLNDLQSDLSTSAPLVAALIGEHNTATDSEIDAIRTGLINAWTNDADIYAGPTAHDQEFTDDVHWTSDAEITILAQRWYRVLSSHFYSGSEAVRGPIFSSAERIAVQLINIVFSGGEGSLNDETDTEGWVIKDGGTPVSLDSVTRLDATTVQIDTSANMIGVVTVDYLSGDRDADAAWRDSGTYPLPPEPVLAQTVSTPPLALTFSPADNVTGADPNANLVITFSESVTPQAGASNDIIIKRTSDDTTVETIDAQSVSVTGGGTSSITINPATLLYNTEYYVQVGADAFDAGDGDSYAGVSDTTSWGFTIFGSSQSTSSSSSTSSSDYSISVELPNGGEVLEGGENYDISWSTDGTGSSQVSFVNLYYSLDAGETYISIATNIINSGSYAWDAPFIEGAEVVVKVEGTDLAITLASDTSDAVFAIETEVGVSQVIDSSPEIGVSPVTGEPQEIDIVTSGDYISGESFDTVYYIDDEMERRPFSSATVYFTWMESFEGIETVTDATLASLDLGLPMLPKAEVVMVKIQSDPKVYAIEGDNTLRWVASEAVASELYGTNWSDYIIDIEPTFIARFEKGEDILSADDYSLDISKAKQRKDLQ